MDMNHEQVRGILRYIDKSQNEEVRKDIFNELGRQCFRCRKVDKWVESFDGNVQSFIDRVNMEGKSPYWQSFSYNEDRSILYLTGKPGERCACSFSEIEDPPVSLCLYCCKAFQENIFGALFRRKVEVEVTESILLGGGRCSTAIHIRGGLS